MAYTATVALDQRSAGDCQLGNSPFGLISGVVTLSNYNQTHAEITGITGLFRSAPRVIVDGISSGKYLTRWDSTDKCITAFIAPLPVGTIGAITPAGTNSAPTITTGTNATTTAPVYTNGGVLTQTTGAAGITGVQAPTFTGTPVTPTFTGTANTVFTEAANATNVGTVKFIAIGQFG